MPKHVMVEFTARHSCGLNPCTNNESNDYQVLYQINHVKPNYGSKSRTSCHEAIR